MSINKLNALDIEAFANAVDLYDGGDLDHYQAIASGSAIYPGQGTPLGLAYCALKLNGEAGELAEHVGKAMRDDHLLGEFFDEEESATFPTEIVRAAGIHKVYSYPSYEMTPERREMLLKEIGDCLWYLGALCRELGTTLSFVALMNLRKLYDRQQRNALRGSGDER